jgi:hypothetical protein
MLTKALIAATVGLLGFGSLALTGCQSTGSNRDVSGETAAVMCDKCKTTWVRTPQRQGTKVTTYKSRQVMTCPDCKSAVANFFSTGKLESYKCISCGGELQTCEVQQ